MLNSSWAERPSTTFVTDMMRQNEWKGIYSHTRTVEYGEPKKKPVTASCANHVQRTAYVGEKCRRRIRVAKNIDIATAGQCGESRRSGGGDGASETVAQWRTAYVTTGQNAAAYRVWVLGSGGRWQRSGEENIMKTCCAAPSVRHPWSDRSNAITTAAALLFCGAREPPTR